MSDSPKAPLMIDVADLADDLVRIHRAWARWGELDKKLLAPGGHLTLAEEAELKSVTRTHSLEGPDMLRKLSDRVVAARHVKESQE